MAGGLTVPDTGLSASMEPEVAVGKPVGAVPGVVDAMVVVAAEQQRVGEVGAAGGRPGHEVVGLGPGAGDVAALSATRLCRAPGAPCAEQG